MTLTRLKQLLNVKYLMVGYLCLLTLLTSIQFKDVGMFTDGILIVLLYTTFDLLWTYLRDKVWYLPVSSWISGFVLTIGALPKPSLTILVALPLLAVASKQLLHFGKNRHIFNPAAFALGVISFFTPSVSWWAVTGETLPTINGLQQLDPGESLFVFSAAFAIIILWRQNRFHVTVPFLLSYIFFLSVLSLSNGIVVNQLSHALFPQIMNSVILFFATIMLIEPLTSTFQTKRQEILYGGLVGLTAVTTMYLAQTFKMASLDPLVYGLLSGNLIASLLFLPSRNDNTTTAKKPNQQKTSTDVTSTTIANEPSYWFRDVPEKRRFPALHGDKQVDVVIIGGGMAGISATYFLSKNAISTTLLEASTICSGDSGYTTACATRFLDSTDASLAAWESSDAAITLFKKIIVDERIDCQWQEVDTACFTRKTDKESLAYFKASFQKLHAKDSSIEYLIGDEASAIIGVPVTAAFRKKASEGTFHPRQFLTSLARSATKNGAEIFEDSAVIDIVLGDQIVVKTKDGSIKTKWLVVATGLPPIKFFPTVSNMLRNEISSVVNVKFAKKQPFANLSFWDDNEPYHYFRSVSETELLVGGEDWKTTESKPTNNPHAQLEKWLQNVVGATIQLGIINSWKGSLFYTPDSLPLVGPHPAYGKNTIFLTGWAGNGTAQGVFAGKIATDLVQQKNNPYHNLFACDRPMAWPIKDTPQTSTCCKNINELAENKGTIIEINGQKLAIVKTQNKIKAFSTVCPHLGCQIEWNDNENTWDCPCHGSRFESDGSLKRGPAKRGLDPVTIQTNDNNITLA